MMATQCQATQYVAAEAAISLPACQWDTTNLPVPRPKHKHLAHLPPSQALTISLQTRLVRSEMLPQVGLQGSLQSVPNLVVAHPGLDLLVGHVEVALLLVQG